jgi:hypothetical protein
MQIFSLIKLARAGFEKKKEKKSHRDAHHITQI